MKTKQTTGQQFTDHNIITNVVTKKRQHTEPSTERLANDRTMQILCNVKQLADNTGVITVRNHRATAAAIVATTVAAVHPTHTQGYICHIFLFWDQWLGAPQLSVEK